jgi:predicted nucleotidyltransferase
MRLSVEEINLLKSNLAELHAKAKLYLFGSRVDDEKRGGDIDLLVVSDQLTQKDLRLLRIRFFERFGEQKMDIVLDDGTFKNPFVRHILPTAIEL